LTGSTSGSVVNNYNFNAFGKTTNTPSATNNTHAFAGEQLDPTGLYFNRARYYNPSLGRFIGRDTTAGTPNDPLSMNRFIYGQDNPGLNADPSGLRECESDGGACTGPIVHSSPNSSQGSTVPVQIKPVPMPQPIYEAPPPIVDAPDVAEAGKFAVAAAEEILRNAAKAGPGPILECFASVGCAIGVGTAAFTVGFVVVLVIAIFFPTKGNTILPAPTPMPPTATGTQTTPTPEPQLQPSTTTPPVPTPSSTENVFRVVLQMQGDDIHSDVPGAIKDTGMNSGDYLISWAWNSNKPLTARRARQELASLLANLHTDQQKRRAVAYGKAVDYIQRCMNSGGCGPSGRTESFQSPINERDQIANCRVDIKIEVGNNLIPG